MLTLEGIVHPLVARNRAKFLRTQTAAGVQLVVLDIPLLYETQAGSQVSARLDFAQLVTNKKVASHGQA